MRNYRQWHAAIGSDAAAADFWRTAFYLGLARFAAEVLLVVAIFFVLKPRPGVFDTKTDSESRNRAENNAAGGK